MRQLLVEALVATLIAHGSVAPLPRDLRADGFPTTRALPPYDTEVPDPSK